MSRIVNSLVLALIVVSLSACQKSSTTAPHTSQVKPSRTAPINSPLIRQLVTAATELTNHTRQYDATYVRLNYPGGDVPLERGVCTDVIIRAFRKNGIDLQKEIHEDMTRQFSAYPQKWNRSAPDANIDHRRVPNLMTYFERQGRALPITDNAQDYLPGDVVAWQLNGNATHIGMITNIYSEEGDGFQVVHHMGGGVEIEDVLFAWRIIGHYRYFK